MTKAPTKNERLRSLVSMKFTALEEFYQAMQTLRRSKRTIEDCNKQMAVMQGLEDAPDAAE